MTVNVIQHTIPTVDDITVNARPHRFLHPLKQELDEQIQDMLDDEIIDPSSSSYLSLVFLVLRGTDDLGYKRHKSVVDFRHKHEKTLKDRYPLPNISDIIGQVGESQFLSTFD